MPFITVKDGAEIFYKDWGNPEGPVVFFSHGWPLSSDNFEAQMFFMANQGCRVVAHDRRGHGRSSQVWEGNNIDQWADDLAELFEKLDVKEMMMVGHSTGGGEIVRYCARHGTSRVSKLVLIDSTPPFMLKSETNTAGVPIEVFDGFRAAMEKDRSQFFFDVASGPFYGFNREGAKKSDGIIYSWWQQGMISGFKATYDCISFWHTVDQTEEMKKIDVPTLIIHGDDDQIVPIDCSARLGIKLLPKGKLIEFPGGPHGLPNIEPVWVNERLLEWLKS
ncbi:non-heme chloroperoxidase [Rhizodiscina lignyota]|uniref:Non-heme chloroperoxidase n=1 Tax=Rhizodiscina lignyota TaxID=1504668 RepID=A0A9P4ISG5_9PEZI|nr:non-heme chloroperoxidase [Rhizodiscina lignyota]